MPRNLQDAYAESGFLTELLALMTNAAGLSCSDRNVRPRLCDIVSSKEHTRIADARFALGADDGAYLRSNVMPLQTATETCDPGNSLSSQLGADLQAAGRMGVLSALEQRMSEDVQDAYGELKLGMRYVAWLLSIPEVFDFVALALTRMNVSARAVKLVQNFRPDAGSVKGAMEALLDFTTVHDGTDPLVVCEEILVALRLLFDMPTKLMEAQLATTLGVDGTGTMKLFDSVDRLALAAVLTSGTREADGIPVPGELLDVPAPAQAQPVATDAFFNVAPTAGGGLQDAAPTAAGPLVNGIRKLRGVFQSRRNDADGNVETTLQNPSPSNREQPPGSALPATQPPDDANPPDAGGDAVPPVPPRAPVPATPVVPQFDAPMAAAISYCTILRVDVLKREPDLCKQSVCAGLSQMREDGGVALVNLEPTKEGYKKAQREGGLSPFWAPHGRLKALRSEEEQDFWVNKLWPQLESPLISDVPQIHAVLNRRVPPPLGRKRPWTRCFGNIPRVQTGTSEDDQTK